MDHEVKRLLVVASGLVVVLFVGRSVVGMVYDDDAVRRNVDVYSRRLKGGGEAEFEPTSGDLKVIRDQRNDLRDAFEGLIPKLQFDQDADFSIRSGDSPDLRYLEILRREQDDLVQRARFEGRSVPGNLGMPELNPTGMEDVLRSLRTLDIVHQVVTAALDAGIDAVEEIREPTTKRRTKNEGGFLKTHRVEFDMRGSSRSVRNTLAGLLEGERYLALDEVRIEVLDPDGEKVRCRFSTLTLTVDPDQDVLTEAGH